MKIAVASSDGKNVNLHFGKAKTLYIYEIKDDEFYFIEKRNVEINEDEKHQGSKVINVISDCDVAIVTQYGPKTKIKANKIGLKIITDEGLIEDVLTRYIEHVKFMNS